MKHSHPSPDSAAGIHAMPVRYRPGNYANLYAGKRRLARL